MPGTCILIPTYNNDRTLGEVIQGSLKHDLHVIVINDGSTDNTKKVLKEFPSVEALNLEPNRGKGFAIAAGLGAASARGYDRVITIDSDLQHDPAEIPVFLQAAKKDPGALFVGCRDMKAGGAPLRNRLGFKMSNFYFWTLTWKYLPDTQSGYRSYPVEAILDLKCPPSRFEYEFLVLIAAARAGIHLSAVPVSVRYEKDIYVSHFRPVADFMKIFNAGLKYFWLQLKRK